MSIQYDSIGEPRKMFLLGEFIKEVVDLRQDRSDSRRTVRLSEARNRVGKRLTSRPKGPASDDNDRDQSCE